MNQSPPQDINAEMSLIGSLILDEKMYKKVSGIVTAESFYKTLHQNTYAAIERLIKDGKPIDLVSVAAELEKMNADFARPDLIKMANFTPTGANAEYHAKIVAEKYSRRQAINALYTALESSYDPAQDIADVVATVKKDMLVNIKARDINSTIYPEIIDVMEKVIESSSGGKKNYIPTGFDKIDRRMNIRKGRLTVIASDPGVGKTSYILCVMRHMVKIGLRPVLFSLEMTREEIIENIIAQEAKVCHRDMVSGNITDHDIKKMMDVANMTKTLNLGVIGNDREWTVAEIRNQCINEMERGIDAVFIDSLGLIKPPKGINRNESRSVVYNLISEELIRLGAELVIPVTVAHHLNKDSTKRSKDWRPTLQSLDFAGARYAHNVGFLYREFLVNPTDENTNAAEFKIAKARDGIPGTIELGFDGPTKTFYNIEQHREPPAVMAGGRQWGN